MRPVLTALVLTFALAAQGPSERAERPEILGDVGGHERRRFEVVFEHAVRCRDEELVALRVFVPVPESGATQTVHELHWTCDGKRVMPQFVADQYGQSTARFELARVGEQEHVVAWCAVVTLHEPARMRLARQQIGRLADIPEEVQKLYTKDLPGVLDLGDALIRAKATELAAGARGLLGEVKSIHDFVATNVRYARDGTWDAAPRVLERGTGSCTEYSYLFAALCRARGIPTRFAGGSVLRTHELEQGPWVDEVWHRWTEVWLPPLGWVPFDVTRDRGERASQDGFGKQPSGLLVVSRHGGQSELLANQYVSGTSHQGSVASRRRFTWRFAPAPTPASDPEPQPAASRPTGGGDGMGSGRR